MNFETWIGLIASSLTTISLLPQLIKIARERKADHISFTWLFILFAGLCFWIYYGFLKKDFIIIISNLVSALINLTIGTLGFIIMRRKSGGG